MTKYPCSQISFEYAIFEQVVDTFIGQKVILQCLSCEVIGHVQSCSLSSTNVKLFGDVSGFVISQTQGVFVDEYIQLPLSPSILGRQLDFFGEPLDGLQPIIGISKPITNFRQDTNTTQKDGQLIGVNDLLINTESFKIQKGQSKKAKSIETILPLLEIANLALVIVELDFESKYLVSFQQLVQQNELDKVTICFQSQSYNDIQISANSVSQVANYLAIELGFDVLILVSNSSLLDNLKSDGFYFAQKFEQMTSANAPGSISVINL